MHLRLDHFEERFTLYIACIFGLYQTHRSSLETECCLPGLKLVPRNSLIALFPSCTHPELASDGLKGRVFEVSLADLQNDEVAFRKFRLIAEDVQGKNVLTNFHGMTMTTDKLRSLVKKWQVCWITAVSLLPLTVCTCVMGGRPAILINAHSLYAANKIFPTRCSYSPHNHYVIRASL